MPGLILINLAKPCHIFSGDSSVFLYKLDYHLFLLNGIESGLPNIREIGDKYQFISLSSFISFIYMNLIIKSASLNTLVQNITFEKLPSCLRSG